MKKNCLECGEPLNGRVDKKFCSDYCRNTYNNKIDKESKNLVRNINNRLRKNHRLLSELNTTGKTKVTRAKLLDGNFDFKFFSSLRILFPSQLTIFIDVQSSKSLFYSWVDYIWGPHRSTVFLI